MSRSHLPGSDNSSIVICLVCGFWVPISNRRESSSPQRTEAEGDRSSSTTSASPEVVASLLTTPAEKNAILAMVEQIERDLRAGIAQLHAVIRSGDRVETKLVELGRQLDAVMELLAGLDMRLNRIGV
ncbi:hypothetical protein SCAR479_12647 [Seiridium cardinale]|uniref:Uncharacterized protein n=1 Tax=Seiridium cardinale TaxID=138064 RepID=A0ABR2XAG1_9PEZI